MIYSAKAFIAAFTTMTSFPPVLRVRSVKTAPPSLMEDELEVKTLFDPADAVAAILARCVRQDGGCLDWAGGRQGKGYGVITYDGRQWLAHRLMYAAAKGPIPAGLQIDHLCRNRACCEPSHLEAVTPRENVMRGAVGERSRRTTHCPQGHEYTPENTKIKRYRNRTSRNCRACEANWQRNHRVRTTSAPVYLEVI